MTRSSLTVTRTRTERSRSRVSTAAPATPRAAAPRGLPDARAVRHEQARLRIFELLRGSQTGQALTAAMVQELIAEAESSGWTDVVLLGLYLAVFCARFVEHGPSAQAIAALHDRAADEADDLMLALALACRAQDPDRVSERAPVEADHDLARATVLLERHREPSSVAVLTHIECAYACEERDLWELQLGHYEAAEQCLDWEEFGAEYLQVLLCNEAETQLFWLAALRESGRSGELVARAAAGRRALAAANAIELPPAWGEAMRAFGELIDAISPPAARSVAPPADPNGAFGGFVHLARAFSSTDRAEAAEHSDRAIEMIDPAASGRVRMLALALSAELEASGQQRPSAGLRWARELAAQRYQRRIASLASLESLIAVERRANEHAVLETHAYRDDLTGLANRRGLTRTLDGLSAQDGATVAVALFDLDDFKTINDLHGHAVGDAVLVRAASILDAGTGDDDLVVRLGGDEFLILLAVADLESAQRRCEALVHAMRTSDWHLVAPGLRVTSSAGAAFGSPLGFEALRADADAALYRAKRAGRACLAR